MGVIAFLFPSSVPVVRRGLHLCSSFFDGDRCVAGYFVVSRTLFYLSMLFVAAVLVEWRWIHRFFERRRAEQRQFEKEQQQQQQQQQQRHTTPLPSSPFIRLHGEPIDGKAFDEGLDQLERVVPDARAGLLSMDRTGVAERVGRESLVMVGGVAAVLDQLAHPFVAHGIAQHSYTMDRPQLRFYNTFRHVFAVMFGSWPEARRTARQVHRTHARIRGQLAHSAGAYRAGEQYAALDQSAALWVLATLTEYSLTMYQALVGPLSDAEQSAYYQWTRATSAVWGIPSDAMPPDLPAFRQYVRLMWSAPVLGSSPPARAMAHFLLMPPPWDRALGVNGMPHLAAYLLAPAVARHFGLELSPTRALFVSLKLAVAKVLYRCVPRPMRHFTKYRRYVHRVRGESPDQLTVWERISNRMGGWLVARTLTPPLGAPKPLEKKLK